MRPRLTFASATSMVAIFVALGGTGYAAVTLADNSVGIRQIKKNAVGGSEIRKNAVRSGEVKNGSLRVVDFRAGILRGPRGPQGVQGPVGQQGGIENLTVQNELASEDLADGATGTYTVFCPAGQVGVGGGSRGDFENSEGTNTGLSHPVVSPANPVPPADGEAFTGWTIEVLNVPAGVTTGIRPEIWVACVTPKQ